MLVVETGVLRSRRSLRWFHGKDRAGLADLLSTTIIESGSGLQDRLGLDNRSRLMELRVMIPRWCFLSIASVGISACGGSERRHYETLAEMRETNDYAIVAGLSVPEDARIIHARHDAETGLFYISYNTSDHNHSVRAKAMSHVEGAARERSRATLGFGESVPADASVYVWCQDKWGAAPDGGPVDKELLFLAIANDRQLQWNEVHNVSLIGEFCR